MHFYSYTLIYTAIFYPESFSAKTEPILHYCFGDQWSNLPTEQHNWNALSAALTSNSSEYSRMENMLWGIWKMYVSFIMFSKS